MRAPARQGAYVILSKAAAGTSHTITACHSTGPTRARLDSLGLVEGERVDVLSTSWAGLILEIKGSRLALCKAVADTMEVSD
jgi:Fe2+ transport system protein FeoA